MTIQSSGAQLFAAIIDDTMQERNGNIVRIAPMSFQTFIPYRT